MDDLMQMAALCQELGWTYDEYMRQPMWFITLLKQKMRIDAKAQEMAVRSMKHGG